MKRNILRLFIFILTLIIWWNFGLAADKAPAYWPTKGWRTASPESQGVDSEILAKMLDMIWEKNIRLNSVLVIRNGYIVMDSYGYTFDADYQHNTYSCSKSVLSALVGIAIDKGYIKDVSQPVLNFFPKRVAENLDADKKAMTLENLLTMTAGLECRDSALYYWSGLKDMKRSADWVKFVIDLPMAEIPGTHFEYCSGASFLLSTILQKQTGMNALAFAKKNLFIPLGITDVSWPSNQQGITVGYSDLNMRVKDMAKIGYLYLNDGLWDGNQILSSQWIKASTRTHITTNSDLRPGYGYQWWIVNSDLYSAIGYKGQFITVMPKKNIIAVFTGRLSQKDMNIPLDLMVTYIIPAIKSPTPLPENTNGAEALKSKITLWQNTHPLDLKKKNKKTEK